MKLPIDITGGALALVKTAAERLLDKYVPDQEKRDAAKLALHQAESQAINEARRLEVEQARVHAEDRASAREREAKVGDKTPAVLACLVVGLFVLVVCAIFFATVPDGSKDIALLLLGALTGEVARVLSYYFGSSQGSKDKQAVIAQTLAKTPAPTTPAESPSTAHLSQTLPVPLPNPSDALAATLEAKYGNLLDD